MRDDLNKAQAQTRTLRVPFGYRSSTYFSSRRG
jgi:hypothetical protein